MMVTILQAIALVWLALNVYMALETARGTIKGGWLIAFFNVIPFALILADFIGGNSAP